MRCALLVVLLAGCPNREPGAVPSERFVGQWAVEQPFHAGYEASWYTFHQDGRLTLDRNCSFDGLEGLTGFVNDPEQTRWCWFGDAWSGQGDSTLAIDGTCDDGVAREIVLGFPDDQAMNTIGVGVEVLSVGGEEGWGHYSFEWRWVKCTPGADCVTAPDLCAP